MPITRLQARAGKKVDPFYRSKEWEQVRYQALLRDKYLCEKCGTKCLGKKFNRPSPNVDHIIPRKERPDLELKLSNLRTLCRSCHSKITMADINGRDKIEIGVDGFPVSTGG